MIPEIEKCGSKAESKNAELRVMWEQKSKQLGQAGGCL
jgi:hypothetical protein